MRGSAATVLVMVGRQPAEDQRHGHHVLDAMVAVGRVVQRAGLVDDAHADSWVSITMRSIWLEPVLDLRMQLHGALGRGLGVELGREGDLEQDVFHDVAAVAALELERLAP